MGAGGVKGSSHRCGVSGLQLAPWLPACYHARPPLPDGTSRWLAWWGTWVLTLMVPIPGCMPS